MVCSVSLAEPLKSSLKQQTDPVWLVGLRDADQYQIFGIARILDRSPNSPLSDNFGEHFHEWLYGSVESLQ